MLNMSSEAIAKKNALADSGAWILLLEIAYEGETPLYLCYNTENIVWNYITWVAYPFNLGDLEESNTGEATSVTLSVHDIGRQLTPLLDTYNGGVGANVYARIVHSSYLTSSTPELEEQFEIIDVAIDSNSVISFKLGSENLSNYRSPPNRYLKGHCRYNEFGGTLCGYTILADETCSRTFGRCRELDNQARFGGFPGIGRLGLYT